MVIYLDPFIECKFFSYVALLVQIVFRYLLVPLHELIHLLLCCSIAQSCLTLWDLMDYGLPGSTVHGICSARILKWIAIPFSRGSFWPKDQTQVCWIAGRCFTIWDTREGLSSYTCLSNSWRMSVSSSFVLHLGYRIKSTVSKNVPSWAPKLWGGGDWICYHVAASIGGLFRSVDSHFFQKIP